MIPNKILNKAIKLYISNSYLPGDIIIYSYVKTRGGNGFFIQYNSISHPRTRLVDDGCDKIDGAWYYLVEYIEFSFLYRWLEFALSNNREDKLLKLAVLNEWGRPVSGR